MATPAIKKIRVLTYHKVGTRPSRSSSNKEWTSLSSLTRTLDKIKRNGLETLLPEKILRGEIPPKAVLLVFLDGYRSFYTTVYPLLKERGLSACVCLPTACVGTYNSWQDPYREPWQDLLTWEEVNELAKDPLISIGAQALNRQDLTLLPAEQAAYCAQESVFRLTKKLSQKPNLFAAYPAQNKTENI
ncbi:MAG: polysaccharide deacetylase family protein, partial [Elusimicrobiaceae bacterium]|nr:polysaccharide deacetylase family protein [Elusimicrobiaceae bacterium]